MVKESRRDILPLRMTVALAVVCVALVLGACAPWAGPPPTSVTPTARLPLGTPDAATPPAGWQRLLDGVRFTSAEGQLGLVASAARPGRLAGCALPAGTSAAATPVFALSDDGGQTWHARTISGIGQTTRCTIVADTQQPDTFVVGDFARGVAYATTDAGRTWQTVRGPDQAPLYVPTRTTAPYSTNATTLVGGHLFVVSFKATPTAYFLWEATIGGGQITWRSLNYTQFARFSPEALAVDPDDPAHIFAALSTGAVGITLYDSRDGGQTWQVVREWPTAYHIALWTAHKHQVFVQEVYGRTATTHQFFVSADGGASWHGIGLHARTGPGDNMYISADGRIVTYYTTRATGGNVFNLDAATGSFSLLGSPVFATNGMFVGIVVDGPSPHFIHASQFATYTLALPSA